MPQPIISSAADSTTLKLFPAGGVTTSQDWLEIADAAREFADSNVYLAAHSSMELHGITDDQGAIQRLEGTSLHTSACRVVASPLDSRARELARVIGQAVPESTTDKLLVGVDAGDGAIAGQNPHVCVHVDSSSSQVRVNTADSEILTTVTEAPQEVAKLLQAFDVSSLEDKQPQTSALPIGWLADHMPEGRVELGVGVYQGIVSADIAELLGRMEVPVSITPWRSLVIHDLAEGDADVVVRVLAPRGLIFDASSPFLT